MAGQRLNTGVDTVMMVTDLSELKVQSIYQCYSRTRRVLVLVAVCLANILPPFADMVYVPSMPALQADLQASSFATAATLAVYLFALGLSAPLWGPVCDRIGRRPTYIASTLAFVACSVGCAFVNSMGLLLVLRVVQGASIGAFTVFGNGVLADVYPPDHRGLAIGIGAMATLAGPTLGALCGGFVGQAFSWRATFIAVAIFAGAILPLLLVCVGETHQYKVVQRLAATNKTSEVAEADSILSNPPKLIMPWAAVACLFDRAVILHVAVEFIGTSALYLSAAILPSHFAAAPYSMSTAEIDLLLLVSLIGVVVSPLAGYLFDRAGRLNPAEPMVRLTYGTAVAILLMPAGLLLLGWRMHARAHIAIITIGWCMMAASTFWIMAGIFAYMTLINPDTASSAISGLVSGNFALSGVCILAGVAIADAVGNLRLFVLLACLAAAATVAAAAQIYRRYKNSKCCGDVPGKDADVACIQASVKSSLSKATKSMLVPSC